MQTAKLKQSITNDTEYYLLVGNYSVIIGHYDNIDDAYFDLNRINVGDSPYGFIQVLEPGEHLEGEFEKELRPIVWHQAKQKHIEKTLKLAREEFPRATEEEMKMVIEELYNQTDRKVAQSGIYQFRVEEHERVREIAGSVVYALDFA